MKLSELLTVPKGTKVWVSQGNGWYEVMTFDKTAEIQSLGKMSLSYLIGNDFDPKKRKKQTIAEVIDDQGKRHYVNPRRLSVFEERR